MQASLYYDWSSVAQDFHFFVFLILLVNYLSSYTSSWMHLSFQLLVANVTAAKKNNNPQSVSKSRIVCFFIFNFCMGWSINKMADK